MNSETGSDALSLRIEEAQNRLRGSCRSAETAEKRATAEIRALEADLEKEKLNTAEALEQLRESHEQDLRTEREAKERAIAAAEERSARSRPTPEAAEEG